MGKIIIEIKQSETDDGKLDISSSFPNGDTIMNVIDAFSSVYGVFIKQLREHFEVDSNEELFAILTTNQEAADLLIREVIKDTEVSNG